MAARASAGVAPAELEGRSKVTWPTVPDCAGASVCPAGRNRWWAFLLKPQANTQTRGKTRTSPVAHLVSVPPPRGQSQKPGMGNRSRK